MEQIRIGMTAAVNSLMNSFVEEDAHCTSQTDFPLLLLCFISFKSPAFSIQVFQASSHNLLRQQKISSMDSTQQQASHSLLRPLH